MAAASDSEARPYPRLYRAADGRLLGGVARGIAVHLGVSTVLVRIAFVVLAFAGLAGVMMYAAFWIVLPLSGPGESGDADQVADGGGAGEEKERNLDLLVVLGLGAVAVGAALLVHQRGLGAQWLVPLLVAGLGVAVLWRQGDDAQRLRWRSRATRAAVVGGPAGWARIALGVLLVVLGLSWALATSGDVGLIVDGMAAGLLFTAGIALVAGPWLIRLLRELGEERRERIRSQERAEVAAHVHDSVLQTLTLIQRNAEDPQAVNRLARAEERALRGWLYRPTDVDAGMLVAALERMAGEVEDVYAATLEVVTVGDVAVDERVVALLQAAREAMVNAAKHAGAAGPVSVYSEVADHLVEVYVRDRGAGFVLADVPEDRLGVRQSVMGRMERNGGSAEIRTDDDGTEVRLTMPLGGERKT